MIPKARILELATLEGLLPTTVEKDYVLGWVLRAIAEHDSLSRWVFKGGTCLKKCFFETYRFSEELDFTVSTREEIDAGTITSGLKAMGEWMGDESGIIVPADWIDVQASVNKRGFTTFQARLTYTGPLNMPRRQLQRVKFDLTQDELLVEEPFPRDVSHPYDDASTTAPRIACYSANEILAEKTRALFEREGRARDVYDIVHLSRAFRSEIDPQRAAEVARQKFAFKGLPPPTVAGILDRVDDDVLRVNWQQQLAHQLPLLPPVDGFLRDLPDALAWWLEPQRAAPPLPAVPVGARELVVRRSLLPSSGAGFFRRAGFGDRPAPAVLRGRSTLHRLRQAARNHLCARLRYHGVSRLVEPYSLRQPRTGNVLLYAHELNRGEARTDQLKAFVVAEIESVSVTDRAFDPRYVIEL